jgi:hypothetical protein
MGLTTELEDMKKQLAEMGDAPVDDIAEDDVVVEEVAADDEPVSEPVVEEPPKEEPKTVAEEEKPDAAAFARMRREKAALERRLQEVEAAKQQPAPVTSPAQSAQEDPEPNMQEDPIAWVQWNKRQTDAQLSEFNNWKQSQTQAYEQNQLVSRAAQELTEYESQFKATVTDYDDVANFMVGELKKSFKRLNPSASEDQVLKQVQQHILLESSKLAAKGLNPVEELYHIAKNEYGYTPPTQAVEKKPDLAAIAKNQARSAGMAGAAGSPKRAAPSTLQAAAEMTPAEWARLPAEDKRRIMGG